MDVNSDVKPEIKPEIKQKKIKKKRKPLNLSLSDDEEIAATEDNLFVKRHEDLKSRLAESRAHTLKNCQNDNEGNEDVFSGNTESDPKTKNKEELNDVLSLLDDLKDKEHNTIKGEEDNVNNDSIIIDSEEWLSNGEQSVSYNTRSRKGRPPQRKASLKKNSKKKKNRRKSGRKSKETEFDPKKVFEKLDGFEAMDDIEVVEDLNTSLNVSQEVEEYIKERDIEIKVKYKAVIEKFLFKSTEKFSKIMPIMAKKFNENVSELIFDFNEQMIDSESTPQLIGLTVSDIIVCHKRVSNKSVDNKSNETKDPNVLSLKLRDRTMKSSETFNVNKFDKIQVIIDLFSTFKGLKPNKISLSFDGDRLDPNLTIAECDIEDDSQIDVKLL